MWLRATQDHNRVLLLCEGAAAGRRRVLQQRRGISTGLASSVNSSRTTTQTTSRTATQTHTVRKTQHIWLNNQRRNPAKRHSIAKSRALSKRTHPPATEASH